MSDDEFRAQVLNGRIVASVGRYSSARLLTERLTTSGRPMLAWALRAVARGRCSIADLQGGERDITIGLLIRWSAQLARERLGRGALLRRFEQQIEQEEQAPPHAAPSCGAAP